MDQCSELQGITEGTAGEETIFCESYRLCAVI